MNTPYPQLPFKVVAYFEHGEIEEHTVTRIIQDTFWFDEAEEKQKPIHLQATWCDAKMCELANTETRKDINVREVPAIVIERK